MDSSLCSTSIRVYETKIRYGRLELEKSCFFYTNFLCRWFSSHFKLMYIEKVTWENQLILQYILLPVGWFQLMISLPLHDDKSSWASEEFIWFSESSSQPTLLWVLIFSIKRLFILENRIDFYCLLQMSICWLGVQVQP